MRCGAVSWPVRVSELCSRMAIWHGGTAVRTVAGAAAFFWFTAKSRLWLTYASATYAHKFNISCRRPPLVTRRRWRRRP